MRRCLFAALLMGGMISMAHADYFVIRVVVKQSEKKGEPGKDTVAELRSGDSVTAIVDVTAVKKSAVKGLGAVDFYEHKFGRTAAYYADTTEIQTQYIKMQVLKAPLDQYKDRYANLQHQRPSQRPLSRIGSLVSRSRPAG